MSHWDINLPRRPFQTIGPEPIHPARRMKFQDLWGDLMMACSTGNVNERKCSRSGLSLFCYTKNAVYQRAWTIPAVVMARGLILDPFKSEIVATPFPKFFNVGEFDLPFPDRPFEAFEKLDGSMVTIFWHQPKGQSEGLWRCATKGSLDSPQAVWSQRWLLKYPHTVESLTKGTTYIAEAIYPENRIVIDYGSEAGLKLLAAYAEDGREVPYADLFSISASSPFGIAQRAPYQSISELVAAQKALPASEEGWVLRFNDGNRLKVKGDEYCRIHRFISRCTPLAVWEWLRDGKPSEDFRKELPEEFWDDFDSIVGIISQKLTAIIVKVGARADEFKELSDKEVGLKLASLDEVERKLIFPMRNQNGDLFCNPKSNRVLFDLVRPTANELEGYKPSTSINRVLAEAA